MKKHPISFSLDVIRVSILLLSVVCSAGAGRKISVPHDFPSIHAALGECDAGDTIFVAKGIYRENIALADNIVLQGEDMLQTIIDGGRNAPCVIGADGAVIRNFTIQNGTVGIICRNTRLTIERNLIVGNNGAGIHAILTLPDITNNIIYRNKWTGIFLESVRSTHSSVDHNVIAENGYSGIFCGGRTGALISNNIITANKEYGIFVCTNAHKTRITSNNFYDNRNPYNSDAVIQKNNIEIPPNFIDPGYPAFNYFVRPVSICKGRGENGSDIGLVEQAKVAAQNQAEPSNEYKNDNKYSDTTALEIKAPLILGGVNFSTASAELETSSYAELDSVVASLKAYPNLKVEIAGHTDEEGSDSYNMALSNDRAKAVMDYLVSHGIAQNRITAKGYGKTQFLVPSTTPEGRAKNRRVEVIPVK
ncbi:MAG: OmpA family protein [Chitinispirillaceae bacterium]|jgi:outer membrane protein OmpA-like peptidoglycan-associated protein